MRRLSIIICSLFLAPLGWSQAAAISGQVLNQYGSPVANAKVYICSAAGSTGTPCSPVATIYSDYNLTQTTPNPTQTDINGNFSVYAGALSFPNIYVVNMVPQSGTVYTQLYNGPACSLGGCTASGPITATLFNATTSPYYEINGVQISSAALSDDSNLAKLNAANVFTGTPQTAPVFNATTEFDVAGVALAASNLSNGVTGSGAVVLATSPTLVTPNIGVASGTSLDLSGNETVGGTLAVTGAASAASFDASTGFQIGATAPSGHLLVGNGSYYEDAASVPSTAVTGLNYQTMALGGTAQTQRPTLNFSSYFTATDSVSPAETTIGLRTVGTDANIATASSGVSGNCPVWDSNGGIGDFGAPCSVAYSFTGASGYQKLPSGIILQWTEGSSCTADCTETVSFPLTFPNACFTVQTTNDNISGTNITKNWGVNSACTTTGVTVELQRRGDEGSFTAAPIVFAIGW